MRYKIQKIRKWKIENKKPLSLLSHLLIFSFSYFLIIAGCSVISRDIRHEVDRAITLPIVQTNPDAFKGKKIIWEA